MIDFRYQFSDKGPTGIDFEYSDNFDEKIKTSIEDHVPALYLNKKGCLFLAKLLFKMAKITPFQAKKFRLSIFCVRNCKNENLRAKTKGVLGTLGQLNHIQA